MKIELWAKKIDRGHVKIGMVDVPESFGFEYRMPVRPEISVIAKPMDVTTNAPVTTVRIFQWKRSLDDKLDGLRRYFEQ